ncbi:hypothetical protein HMPREF1980_00189 [Actinomyces sp. oral taxon 172 str. F0311]|nr:hypothetical protein HMPREF1980_00189 [Actinomyces sp. oral taxon 172 str. F0311]
MPELSTKPRNVAIPTIQLQHLKGLHGNYVRHCWGTMTSLGDHRDRRITRARPNTPPKSRT